MDRDETVLTPRERDLMFVVSGLAAGLVGPREEACCFTGYGETSVDPATLAYYRHARAIDDLADYAQRVFCSPTASAETKRAALERFIRCFQLGGIVAPAHEADRHLASPPSLSRTSSPA